ncbi:hypothetical protein CYY_005906 [Polysphondylium violaceum]|uniref:Uncharacterized protein n=1 Tax=Polysphondylium violaceum TaxID=133409 RepID=A0A8J4PR99_9MYCE|nr:hypothetical protein CYY_005906 [Polysphondylium violaceum]
MDNSRDNNSDGVFTIEEGCQVAKINDSSFKQFLAKDKSDKTRYIKLILTNSFDRYHALSTIGYVLYTIDDLLSQKPNKKPNSLVNQYFRDTITNYAKSKSRELLDAYRDSVLGLPATNTEIVQVLMNIYREQIDQSKIQEKQSAIDDLNRMISGLDNGIYVFKPYGSFVNGIMISNSDVDLSLFKDSQTLSPQDQVCVRDFLAKRKEVQSVQLVQSRLPIIKLVHSNIDFDVSFGNHSAVDNSLLLRAYAQADPRAHAFLVLIKKWAAVKFISSAAFGYLSSYAYSCLSIFFLQTIDPPVLPCIKLDQISGLNWSSANTLSIDQLLLKFFIFYSTFDFSQNLVSISKGVMTRVQDCPTMPMSPTSCVYIQDPLIDDFNTAKSLKPGKLDLIKLELYSAVCILTSGSPTLSANLFLAIDKSAPVLVSK